MLCEGSAMPPPGERGRGEISGANTHQNFLVSFFSCFLLSSFGCSQVSPIQSPPGCRWTGSPPHRPPYQTDPARPLCVPYSQCVCRGVTQARVFRVDHGAGLSHFLDKAGFGHMCPAPYTAGLLRRDSNLWRNPATRLAFHTSAVIEHIAGHRTTFLRAA